MYSHKLQNATPHDLVAHGMWSVGGGGARDFGPSSSCISPPPVQDDLIYKMGKDKIASRHDHEIGGTAWATAEIVPERVQNFLF